MYNSTGSISRETISDPVNSCVGSIEGIGSGSVQQLLVPALVVADSSDALQAGSDEHRLDKARVLKVSLNTSPDSQVGVIPSKVGVAGVAVAQLHGRDARAVVMCFPICSGWSVQQLTDRRASLDRSALVLGKIAVGALFLGHGSAKFSSEFDRGSTSRSPAPP